MKQTCNVIVLLADTLYFCGFSLLEGRCAVPRFQESVMSLQACNEDDVKGIDFIRFPSLALKNPVLANELKKRGALCTQFQLIDDTYFQTNFRMNWGENEVREAGFSL